MHATLQANRQKSQLYIIIIIMHLLYCHSHLTSKEPLKNQAWGTSLFTNAVSNQRGCIGSKFECGQRRQNSC